MGRLPQGRITKHIQASNSADCNRDRFYVTQYSTVHGKEGFLPRLGKPNGTGYKSNFRPGLYYSKKLDELDNPDFGYEELMFLLNHLQMHTYLFKANNRDIRTTSMTTSMATSTTSKISHNFSGLSIVDYEQVIVGWVKC